MRRYRSYKFTDKHHSKGGIRSSVAAAISLACTAAAVYGAYAAKGNGARYLAFFGFVAIVSCCYGFFTGYLSFKEEESYYLFSKIGTSISCVLLVFWIAVFGVGFVI